MRAIYIFVLMVAAMNAGKFLYAPIYEVGACILACWATMELKGNYRRAGVITAAMAALYAIDTFVYLPLPAAFFNLFPAAAERIESVT